MVRDPVVRMIVMLITYRDLTADASLASVDPRVIAAACVLTTE